VLPDLGAGDAAENDDPHQVVLPVEAVDVHTAALVVLPQSGQGSLAARRSRRRGDHRGTGRAHAPAARRPLDRAGGTRLPGGRADDGPAARARKAQDQGRPGGARRAGPPRGAPRLPRAGSRDPDLVLALRGLGDPGAGRARRPPELRRAAAVRGDAAGGARGLPPGGNAGGSRDGPAVSRSTPASSGRAARERTSVLACACRYSARRCAPRRTRRRARGRAPSPTTRSRGTAGRRSTGRGGP
jgi:hypothetical protein